MKVHITKYSYPNKVRAKIASKLIIDLLTSNQDLPINEIINNILDKKIIIPANLSTCFYDINSYNILNDTINSLVLSEHEINNINEHLNNVSVYQYKDINFSKALLKIIIPNKPFIINHRFCWSNQSLFIINIKSLDLIKKAKDIGLAFWYQPLYPEDSYNLMFVTELIDDYRIAYLLNQALNYYFDNSSNLSNSDLSSYFYGVKDKHSGFKNINTKLDINKLLRNIQSELFKIDSNMISDIITNFEAKIRLRHCKLILERTFHLFACHNPRYFIEKNNPYYKEFSNLGFMFIHQQNESKLEKVFTAQQVKQLPIVNLNFKLDNKSIQVPLKSAKHCCQLLADLLSKESSCVQEDIDLIVSNIRYLKFGIRELLSSCTLKHKIFWSLSHYNYRISCDKCKYKDNCTSITDLYSHLLSLDKEYINNTDYEKFLVNKSINVQQYFHDILQQSFNNILINNADPILHTPYFYPNRSIILSNILPVDDIVIPGTAHLLDLNLNKSKLFVNNSYMAYIIPKYKPEYIYLDDSFIFSNLIKVFIIPSDIITVKNFLLSSDLFLTTKNKILLLFNQINLLNRIEKIAVCFTTEEVNDIVALLKKQKFHYIWYYLFQTKSVFLFREFNLYSQSSYTIYYFYFNTDLLDYPTKFIITSAFDKLIWDKLNIKYDYFEIKSKLENVYLHPKYSFSYSYLKNIKNFLTSREYQYIKSFLSDRDVIVTHKSMLEFFINNGFIRVSPTVYFGSNNITNLRNDLTIIGTPRLKEVYYFAIATLLGVSLDKLNKTKFGSYKIVYRGLYFPFRAYSLQILNDIMCQQIEGEFRKICACIGNGNKINIFSNFYLPSAQIVW